MTNKQPRFEHRFNNGVHQVFDRVLYRAVSARRLGKAAKEEVARRNAEGQRRA